MKLQKYSFFIFGSLFLSTLIFAERRAPRIQSTEAIEKSAISDAKTITPTKIINSPIEIETSNKDTPTISKEIVEVQSKAKELDTSHYTNAFWKTEHTLAPIK